MTKTTTLFLVAVLTVTSALASPSNVVGSWRHCPVAPLNKEFAREMGIELPEKIVPMCLKATIEQDGDCYRFTQTRDDGTPLTPPIGYDTCRNPLGFKIIGRTEYVTVEELEDGIVILVHPGGTDVYYEELFEAKKDSNQLIRTYRIWKSGNEIIHTYKRVSDEKEEL